MVLKKGEIIVAGDRTWQNEAGKKYVKSKHQLIRSLRSGCKGSEDSPIQAIPVLQQ
jgi:hypothetical protein